MTVQHYSWPDLGETVEYKHLKGEVVSRNMGEMFFTIHEVGGNYYNVDLADFIVDQIADVR